MVSWVSIHIEKNIPNNIDLVFSPLEKKRQGKNKKYL